jgi:hypothetical protein
MESSMTFDEERIAHFKGIRDKALKTVERIDKGEVRFAESVGNNTMADCTAAYREECESYAKSMTEIIDNIEKDRSAV